MLSVARALVDAEPRLLDEPRSIDRIAVPREHRGAVGRQRKPEELGSRIRVVGSARVKELGPGGAAVARIEERVVRGVDVGTVFPRIGANEYLLGVGRMDSGNEGACPEVRIGNWVARPGGAVVDGGQQNAGVRTFVGDPQPSG